MTGRRAQFLDTVEILPKKLPLPLENLYGPPGTHRQQSEVEKEADEPVARDLVLHHEEGFLGFQNPNDFVEASTLALSLQFIEGMGTSDRIENGLFERQAAGVRLDQANGASRCDFASGGRKHTAGKVYSYHHTIRTDLPTQFLEQ